MSTQILKKGNSSISFEIKQGVVLAHSIKFSGLAKDLSYFINMLCKYPESTKTLHYRRKVDDIRLYDKFAL